MEPIRALLINVGSNSNEKNGIAPIYSDGTFEYWPIKESHPGPSTPRFRDLGIDCPYPDLWAHYDPRFEPMPTYGDVRDVPAFRSLADSVLYGELALLLFAATLKYTGKPSLRPQWISPRSGYYVIGFFMVDDICFASDKGITDWCSHELNAHYFRPAHDEKNVKLLVRGSKGSRLLKKPFPISSTQETRLRTGDWLKQNFRELRGGPIGEGPWFRRTFRNAPGTTSESILLVIAEHESEGV